MSEIISTLEAAIAVRMKRRYARLVGRGTTALYVALRALASVECPGGEIILPDLICSTVLDAVLLAGFTPVLADVTPDRFTLNANSVRQKITSQTRAVIAAHLFGHVAALSDFGVPLIEDAVQGLGGAVGQVGVITFISFDDTKMIGGRGGVVLTDDQKLWDAIQCVELTSPTQYVDLTDVSRRYRAYWPQLAKLAGSLIRPFDESPENVERIETSWARLAANVCERNTKAGWLRERLAGLPTILPEIRPGDAIWRYSFAATSVSSANWILRRLQSSGLRGSSLYPPLSTIFAPEPDLFSTTVARRMINLWVDQTTTEDDLRRAAEIICSAPF